jgi:hypothetical protein
VNGRCKAVPWADFRVRIAREALIKTWASFPAALRTLCAAMNRAGGPPSYAEMLTCLEVMRDASP